MFQGISGFAVTCISTLIAGIGGYRIGMKNNTELCDKAAMDAVIRYQDALLETNKELFKELEKQALELNNLVRAKRPK